jgi:hypothetical protein
VGPEKIESWIAPYVGNRVAWEPAYVEIDGRHVLFITVEAPRWGEPPFPLRKEGGDELSKTMRNRNDELSVGEHQRVFWPSAGLAPPVATAPLAVSGLASRLLLRREFGEKLAKVFPVTARRRRHGSWPRVPDQGSHLDNLVAPSTSPPA